MAFQIYGDMAEGTQQLEDEIGAHQNDLVDIASRLTAVLDAPQKKDTEILQRLDRKLQVAINQAQVVDSNDLTVTVNQLLSPLQIEQDDHNGLLQQLAAKCNWCKVGEPLPNILCKPGPCGPALQYGGTL